MEPIEGFAPSSEVYKTTASLSMLYRRRSLFLLDLANLHSRHLHPLLSYADDVPWTISFLFSNAVFSE